MWLEEEAAGRRLAIDSLADATEFAGKSGLIFPDDNVLERRIRKSQVEGLVREAGLARIAFHHGEAGWNLLFIDVEEHDVAATNAYPDFGRSPEIDNVLDPGKKPAKTAESPAAKMASQGPEETVGQVSA